MPGAPGGVKLFVAPWASWLGEAQRQVFRRLHDNPNLLHRNQLLNRRRETCAAGGLRPVGPAYVPPSQSASTASPTRLQTMN